MLELVELAPPRRRPGDGRPAGSRRLLSRRNRLRCRGRPHQGIHCRPCKPQRPLVLRLPGDGRVERTNPVSPLGGLGLLASRDRKRPRLVVGADCGSLERADTDGVEERGDAIRRVDLSSLFLAEPCRGRNVCAPRQRRQRLRGRALDGPGGGKLLDRHGLHRQGLPGRHHGRTHRPQRPRTVRRRYPWRNQCAHQRRDLLEDRQRGHRRPDRLCRGAGRQRQHLRLDGTGGQDHPG